MRTAGAGRCDIAAWADTTTAAAARPMRRARIMIYGEEETFDALKTNGRISRGPGFLAGDSRPDDDRAAAGGTAEQLVVFGRQPRRARVQLEPLDVHGRNVVDVERANAEAVHEERRTAVARRPGEAQHRQPVRTDAEVEAGNGPKEIGEAPRVAFLDVGAGDEMAGASAPMRLERGEPALTLGGRVGDGGRQSRGDGAQRQLRLAGVAVGDREIQNDRGE